VSPGREMKCEQASAFPGSARLITQHSWGGGRGGRGGRGRGGLLPPGMQEISRFRYNHIIITQVMLQSYDMEMNSTVVVDRFVIIKQS